jgi:hypothetical protein
MRKTVKRIGQDCPERHLAVISRTLSICIALFLVIAPFAVFAADDGVYLAATNTYYLNPDTGVTDDGGSKNAAIGEGMCRSVIYEKALVEIEDGKVYATVRVQLVSNMGAIKFTVQQKAGDPASYSSVSPRVIAEDAGADTADYRFALPSVNSYIGCSTYVTPMGRDVKFYMNLSSNLTAGSSDFVVSVKPKTTQVSGSEVPAAQEPETPAAQTSTSAETDVVAAPPPGARTPANAQASSEAETKSDAVPGANTPVGNTTVTGAEENGAIRETGEAVSGDNTTTGTEEGGADKTDSEATDIAASENEPGESSGVSDDSLPGDNGDSDKVGAQGDGDTTGVGFPMILTLVVIAIVITLMGILLAKNKMRSN